MIAYTRDPQSTVPLATVKIIGLGGAGANILERIARDGMDGVELLALNTDSRTLGSCPDQARIQLGVNLTKGLGTGGDPELGHQAALEAENAIRAALKGSQIVFLCAGLGGGTGSGAAPLVTRIAREEGAFVVVFATMPFAFEGKRRREQAETALNQLTVLSNALVTFDNDRMGELVLAQQGIHEAFVAADEMISESIKAVIRLVVRPGLIRIGLDDLVSALRANRSRCLFGSGIASGENRAAKALHNALASPLLDQGALLKNAQTVLVHLAGGEDLSLFEIEQLMQQLQLSVPDSAHVLFGAAVDPAMGDSLSVTLISAMPEDALAAPSRDAHSQAASTSATAPPAPSEAAVTATPEVEPVLALETQAPVTAAPSFAEPRPSPAVAAALSLFDTESPATEPELESQAAAEAPSEEDEKPASAPMVIEFVSVAAPPAEDLPLPQFDGDAEAAEPIASAIPAKSSEDDRWKPAPEPQTTGSDLDDESMAMAEAEPPKLKLGVKPTTPQSELSLDSSPRGRFEGENPNVYEGEDLDLPPFLRKKK